MPTQRKTASRVWNEIVTPALDTLAVAPFRAAYTLMHHDTITRAERNPAYRALADAHRAARANRTRVTSWEELRTELHQWDQQQILEHDASLNWTVEEFLARATHSTPVSTGTRHLRWGWQRLTRGWDDRATWSLDAHLTRTLGQQLLHLADTTHGWPDTVTDTFDAWAALLREHGNTLLRYSATAYDTDRQDGEAAIHAAQESLQWVAQHLPHLWD